jgi:hypothetical protein
MQLPGTVTLGLEAATLRSRYEPLTVDRFRLAATLTQDVECSAQIAVDNDAHQGIHRSARSQ